jgi:hypothetical protein
MREHAYQPGQVWTFRGAPLPESRVVIGTIDRGKHHDWVFSVSIIKVPFPDLAIGGTRIADMAHVPVTRAVLDSSLLENVGAGEPADAFAEGYASWRSAFDAGEAGAFTIGISAVIDAIRQAVGNRR